MKSKKMLLGVVFTAGYSLAIAQAPYVDPAEDAEHFGSALTSTLLIK